MPREGTLSSPRGVLGGEAALAVEPYGARLAAPRWARNGHVQTLLGQVLPAPATPLAELPGSRLVEIPLPDGERLVAHHLPGKSGARVLLLHGLTGDADADYMRRAAAALAAQGHDLWAVNHRGCGAGRGLAHRPYHSGKTEDLQAVLAASRAELPGAPQVVVGFSLSGNLALLHAAEDHPLQPDGILAVNPPIDLARTTRALNRGLNRLYQLRFLWRLRRAVRERVAAGRTKRDYRIPLFASMLEFDDLFTAPECGFADGRDYYRRASAGPRLAQVAVPSVLISAADDPFVPADCLAEVELSPAIHVHLEPWGGHVGYAERRDGRWTCWLDGALEHYVQELLRAV